MQQIKTGDKVKVHYEGRLSDGSIFDSSAGKEPLEFIVGNGQIIKGFDDAIMDMKVGDKKTVNILCVDAYGDRNEDMVMEYPIDEFPEDMEPEIGMELQMSDDDGNIFPVLIVEVHDEFVILDANHPLAGEDLTFDIELVEIA